MGAPDQYFEINNNNNNLLNLSSFTISEANYRLTLGYHGIVSFIYNYISSTLINHFFLTISKYFPTFCMCSIFYFRYSPARYFCIHV